MRKVQKGIYLHNACRWMPCSKDALNAGLGSTHNSGIIPKSLHIKRWSKR